MTLSWTECSRELLVENLEKVSLVSQRMVYDHVMSTEKPLTEYYISNDLLKSCRLAHSRCTAALEENKNALIKGEKKPRKRKLKLEEIAEVKEKRKAVES